jgi:hypothetical protein
MARTALGALLEMIRREAASRIHGDLVLKLETGPASTSELTEITKNLRAQFPGFQRLMAGGDSDGCWKVSIYVKPNGAAETVRQDLLRWAAGNEPFVRNYAIRQRSLWRTAEHAR